MARIDGGRRGPSRLDRADGRSTDGDTVDADATTVATRVRPSADDRPAAVAASRIVAAHRPPPAATGSTRRGRPSGSSAYLTALILVGGATFAALQVVHLDLVFTQQHADRRRHGRARDGPGVPPRPPAPATSSSAAGATTGTPGFPMYRFYMVVPALMIVAAQRRAVPYGVAFKIVAVLGVVTLPFCCWAFGRLARFRYPMPELFALAGAAVPVRRELLDLRRQREEHDGGRVLVLASRCRSPCSASACSPAASRPASTAAGRRSCSRWRACRHGIVLIFVVVAAVLLWLVWMDRTRFMYGLDDAGRTASC